MREFANLGAEAETVPITSLRSCAVHTRRSRQGNHRQPPTPTPEQVTANRDPPHTTSPTTPRSATTSGRACFRYQVVIVSSLGVSGYGSGMACGTLITVRVQVGMGFSAF